VFQFVAVRAYLLACQRRVLVLDFFAMCCRKLQCVAVMYCVAGCCAVLQCVAVRVYLLACQRRVLVLDFIADASCHLRFDAQISH